MNFKVKKYLTILFFIAITNYLNGQDLWPFKDANGNVVRGRISGVVGDYRSSSAAGNGGARFHAGTDFVSPHNGPQTGRAVYSMHAGTVTVNQTQNCWSSYIAIHNAANNTRTYYKHIVPANFDPVTNQAVIPVVNGQQVAIGDFLGLMVTSNNDPASTAGNCSQHVHINENNLPFVNTSRGETNFLNNFLNPFSDTGAPDFIFPFNIGNNIIPQGTINTVAEFWKNGKKRNETSTELNQIINYNNETYKLIYDKVDIVSRIRDRHIQTNGTALNPGPNVFEGNNGIYKASYEIFNYNNQSVDGSPVNNIDFSNVPENNIAQYIFSSRSSSSRHIYILTGTTEDANHPDRWFNTRLAKGQTENWELNNRGSKDAKFISDAHYKDGAYYIEIKAEDISNQTGTQSNQTVRRANILIDNFKPYIKKVIVQKAVFPGYEPVVYSGEWVWDNNKEELKFISLQNGQVSGEGIKITITSSEPLSIETDQQPTIQIDDFPEPIIQNLTEDNKEQTEFVFIIPYGSYNPEENIVEKTLRINGYDLAGNQIEGYNSNISEVKYETGVYQFVIPRRHSDGNWLYDNPGIDTRHSFKIGGSCGSSNGRTSCPLFADFTHTPDEANPLEIKFTDTSVPQEDIASWSWEYNDEVFSQLQNPVHTFEAPGQYTVTLTINSNSGQEPSSRTIEIDVQEPSNPNIIAKFSTNKITGELPLEISFTDESETDDWIIESWSWDFGDENTSTEQYPIHEFTSVGIFEVVLTITIDSKEYSSEPTTIVVTNENSETCEGDLVVDFDHDTKVYSSVSFDLIDSSVFPFGGKTGSEYTWTFPDGTEIVENSGKISYSFPGTGNYDVTLCVKDGCGNVLCKTKTINVLPPETTVRAQFSGPSKFIVGEEITFYDNSFPNEDIVAWSWNFDLPEDYDVNLHPVCPQYCSDLYYTKDNYQQTVRKTYDTSGKYLVALTVQNHKQIQGNIMFKEIEVLEPGTSSPIKNEDDILEDFFSGDKLRNWVDIEGNYAVITGSRFNAAGSNDHKDRLVVLENLNGIWTQISHLETTPYNESQVYFEEAYISGNSIIATDNKNIYLYDKGSNNWGYVYPSQIIPITLNSEISIHNDLFITTDKQSGLNYINVYQRSDSDWSETPTQTINCGDNEISKIDIYNNTIIAGVSSQNKVLVFEYSTSGWVQTATLTSTTQDSNTGFGSSIAIEDKTIVVGAPYEGECEGTGCEPGAAYVFSKNGTNWTDMTQTARLNAFDGQNLDENLKNFGLHVSISNNRIMVNSLDIKGTGYSAKFGAMYIFEPTVLNEWTDMSEKLKLLGSDGYNWHYSRPSIHKNTVMITRPAGNMDSYNGNGKLYIFELNQNSHPCYTEYIQESYEMSPNSSASMTFGKILLGGNPSAGYIIPSGANLDLKAMEITLDEGFEADINSNLLIETVDCETIIEIGVGGTSTIGGN